MASSDQATDAGLDELLAENARRNAALDTPYDPITGTGDVVGDRRRVEVGVEGIEALHVPVQMWGDGHAEGLLHGYDAVPGMMQAITDAGGVVPAAERLGVEPITVLDAISEVRHAFDFEYWAAAAVWIRGDKGQKVRFRLNRAQRRLLGHLLELFWAGRPIRIILLKARQWGGSTLTQVFMVWIQEWHRMGWHAAVVADVEKQASHILGMYEYLGQHYALREGGIRLHPYQRQNDVRYRRDRECYLGVGSVKQPDAARSFTNFMLHMSEVGSWKSTPVQNAEDFAQALEGGIAAGRTDLPMTLCVKESTAKGVGQYFHKEWLAAEQGESNDRPVFIPWLVIDKLRERVDDPAAFVASWDRYERALWQQHGCSIEQIAWYRSKLKSFRGKRFKMHAENPTTPQEAFQSTGARFYAPEAVAYARSTCRPPRLVGELRGKAAKGRDALEGLRLVELAGGHLQVWRLPSDRYGGLLRDVPIARRFCIFADPGGKTDTADWSVAKVLDRGPMLFGGRAEVAAVWRGHLRPDLFAWTCAQLGRFYLDALLAIEANRMRKDRGDADRGFEPEWSAAVLEEIMGEYHQLFLREKEARADDPTSWDVGYWMTEKSKGILVNTLDEALEDQLYVERSVNACDELDTFEAKPDGRLGARDGCHDDEAIATMGVVWLGTKYEHLAPPRYVEPDDTPSRQRQLAGTPAAF